MINEIIEMKIQSDEILEETEKPVLKELFESFAIIYSPKKQDNGTA